MREKHWQSLFEFTCNKFSSFNFWYFSIAGISARLFIFTVPDMPIFRQACERIKTIAFFKSLNKIFERGPSPHAEFVKRSGAYTLLNNCIEESPFAEVYARKFRHTEY